MDDGEEFQNDTHFTYEEGRVRITTVLHRFYSGTDCFVWRFCKAGGFDDTKKILQTIEETLRFHICENPLDDRLYELPSMVNTVVPIFRFFDYVGGDESGFETSFKKSTPDSGLDHSVIKNWAKNTLAATQTAGQEGTAAGGEGTTSTAAKNGLNYDEWELRLPDGVTYPATFQAPSTESCMNYHWPCMGSYHKNVDFLSKGGEPVEMWSGPNCDLALLVKNFKYEELEKFYLEYLYRKAYAISRVGGYSHIVVVDGDVGSVGQVIKQASYFPQLMPIIAKYGEQYWPLACSNILIHNAPTGLTQIWAVVKTFLSKETTGVVKIKKEVCTKDIRELMNGATYAQLHNLFHGIVPARSAIARQSARVWKDLLKEERSIKDSKEKKSGDKSEKSSRKSSSKPKKSDSAADASLEV